MLLSYLLPSPVQLRASYPPLSAGNLWLSLASCPHTFRCLPSMPFVGLGCCIVCPFFKGLGFPVEPLLPVHRFPLQWQVSWSVVRSLTRLGARIWCKILTSESGIFSAQSSVHESVGPVCECSVHESSRESMSPSAVCASYLVCETIFPVAGSFSCLSLAETFPRFQSAG